jgi:hypothetical protein
MGWNPKFDIDLQYGEEGERWLRWVGTDQAKVEVKTERDQWYTTGNVVFEFSYKGRPSGIASTESDWWVIVFKLGDKFCGSMVLPVQDLKEYLRGVYAQPDKYGAKVWNVGDNDDSRAIVLPIKALTGMLTSKAR